MDATNLLVFAAAYLAVVLLPGPGVTALVARVISRGPQATPAYIAGFVTGSVLWLWVAATGLAALATAFGALFVAVRYAGAIYLLYLAWKLWTAPARPVTAHDATPDSRLHLFLAGVALNLGNPKAVVFFLALLPTVVDLRTLTAFGLAELTGVVAVVVSTVFGAYAVAAERARRLFSSPRASRMLNRAGALALAGTAAALSTR